MHTLWFIYFQGEEDGVGLGSCCCCWFLWGEEYRQGTRVPRLANFPWAFASHLHTFPRFWALTSSAPGEGFEGSRRGPTHRWQVEGWLIANSYRSDPVPRPQLAAFDLPLLPWQDGVWPLHSNTDMLSSLAVPLLSSVPYRAGDTRVQV